MLYRSLGFEADAYDEAGADGAPVYGFLRRDDVHIHLARVDELDPRTSMSACYLYVSDADALFAAWKALAPPGRLSAPQDTPYGLREFAYVDPNGNLMRVGSELEATSR